MSNSTLVTYRHITKHKNSGRGGNRITKIFVHHMAGCLTVKQCGNVFDNRQASAHYGVNGTQIGQYVDEKDTAWHCGNFSWNQKSIGIELANDSGSPNWHVSESTINTAIKLIADICKRNGIPQLIYTGDMEGNLCMHKWVCSTSCPGPYLQKQFNKICVGVNKLLGQEFPSPYGKLEEDGIGGPDTVGTLQRFLGTEMDFVISGQDEDYAKYYPALEAVDFDSLESDCVKHIQWLVGVYEDGILGPITVRGIQKLVGVEEDGILGPVTMKALQHYLNTHEKAVYPSTHAAKPEAEKPVTPIKPADTNLAAFEQAIKTQYNWSKKQKYQWVLPTVANSKNKGTCITLVSVALQRMGLLKSKQYFYYGPKSKKISGNAASYVKKHPEIFYVSYPHKTVRELYKEGKLKKNDIIGFGNPNYHTMVFKGVNKSGDFIFDTMGHRRGLNITYPYYAKRKVDMIVRLKKTSK